MTGAAVTALRAEDAGEAAAWDALVDAAPTPDVYYRPGYVAPTALAAGAPAVALVVAAAGVRALVPLLVRPLAELSFAPGEPGGDAITPYGYGGVLLLDDPGAGAAAVPGLVAALREYLAGAGLVAALLRLHPLLAQHAWPWAAAGAEYRHHGPSTAVELGAWNAAAGCIATLRKGHRADLGAARKALEVRWGVGPAALAQLRALYEDTMDRLSAGAAYRFPPAYYAGLAAGLGDRLALALAYAPGAEAPVAGALFMAEGAHAHYHLSATSSAARVRGATALLINEGAAWARGRGARWLHLGGGTTGADALYHFKKGFGGVEHTYGLVALIADPARYASLVARRDAARGGPGRPGFFPEYRA